MPRPKYSEEQKAGMVTAFVQAAVEILEQEGLEAISLRKVASKTGYNSATLYHYFVDLDHLLVFTCLKRMKRYSVNLADCIGPGAGPMERYLAVWDAFCDSAFSAPGVYYFLFFGPHKNDLGAMMEEYYGIFPEDLGPTDPELRTMLRAGSLEARNMSLLRLACEGRPYTEEQLVCLNEVTVYYFKELLFQKCREAGMSTARLKARMQTAIQLF